MASSTGTGAGVFQTSPTLTTPTISQLSSAAATALTLQSAGTTAITVDTSQNVGVGTTSPSYKLHVVKGASDNAVVIDNGGGAGDNTNPYLAFSGTSGGANFIRGRIRGAFPDATGGGLVFDTGASGSMSERMRIASNGDFLVGTTTTGAANTQGLYLNSASGATYASIGHVNGTGSGNGYLIFLYNGANIGYISQNGTTAVAYNTSSDYRLKENIAPMTGALAKVAQLKPVTYKWKLDGSDGQGFIAHELQEVVPDCVAGEKDAVDANGKPMHQGVDTSFLVATLTAAIQEQQALITALTARITALENT
jgi:hypothetical protein